MNLSIEKTMDYSRFKFLEDNRAVKDARVNKIINSINKVGYIINPILVNENYEIVDGQGRFLALKKLGLPQYYIMQAGIGIEECRCMNINQTNWTMMDYIISHAKSGNPNYLRLKSLIDDHAIKPTFIITLVVGADASIGGNTRKLLADGDFVLTRDEYDKIKWVIDYADKFVEISRQIGGKQDHFFIAIGYAYKNLNTNQRNRLEEVIKKNVAFIPSLNLAVDYLKVFDSLYNKGKHKNGKINLEMSWRMEQM